MAVKTKDINFNNVDFANVEIMNGKGYTAIYMSDVTQDDVSTAISMSIEDGYLKIEKDGKTLKLTNYSGIKYIKTDYQKVGKKESYNLTDIIVEALVDNTANVISTYNPKNLTVTGTTNYNDNIDVSGITGLQKTVKKQKIDMLPSDKGFTIDGGNGNDIIKGSIYSDTIKGGNGNDDITGGTGNDTITGGAGVNVINHSIGDGNDTINLTKGEKFTLNLTDLTENDLKFKIEKGALIISYDKVVEEEHVTGSIKLNNFGSKDVTNNSTKKTADASSVEMILSGGEPINLRTYLYKLNVTSNYSGGWLNEDIDASNVEQKHDKKGKPLQTGVTINGRNGNDIITGSNYNDTINGGTGVDTIFGGLGDDKINAGDGDDVVTGGQGNDTISGGKGSDTFIFNEGDGADTITDATKEDVLQLNGISSEDIFFLKTGNSLQIRYNLPDNNDSITINNFFDKKGNINANAIDKIHTSDCETAEATKSLRTLLADYTYPITGQGKINGGNGADTIYGSIANDTINAGKGDDTIYASKGNDNITGGEGVNRIIYNKTGFGTDTINLTKNEKLTIDLSALNLDEEPVYEFTGKNKKDLTITTAEGTIVINNFGSSDVTTGNGEVKLKLSAEETVDLRTKIYEVTATSNYTGNWHNETIDASGVTDLTKTVGSGKNKHVEPKTNSDAGLSINAGAGNDTITGTQYSDTLTGGAGENRIIVKNEAFGNDTINLTNGEKLTIDLTSYNDLLSAEKLKGKVKVSGKNLEIILGENRKLILNNFANSNVVGNNGYVRVKLSGEENYVDLNNDEVLEYTVTDDNYNSKTKLDTFTGSRFSETITANGLTHGTSITTGAGINTVNLSNATGNNTINGGADKDIVSLNNSANTTVKAGEGENEINISGEGNNTIISGKYNDIININENTATTTIQTGAGTNTIIT